MPKVNYDPVDLKYLNETEEGRKYLRDKDTPSLSTHGNIKWQIKNERLHFTRKNT